MERGGGNNKDLQRWTPQRWTLRCRCRASRRARARLRARARAKEANKRNEEFDQNVRRRGAQNGMTRSLKNNGALRTAANVLTTTPAEREAREDKRVADLKEGRTRAGERLIAEGGKKRDAETKARVAKAAQADIDRRSAKSGAKLEAEMNRKAENARKLANAKKTQKAVADFTGETGKQARLSDAARRARANKTITMSPDDFANVPSVPPAKVEANRINKKAMTAAEVKAMKNNPLNAKRAGKAKSTSPNSINKKAMTAAEISKMLDKNPKSRAAKAAQVEKNQGKALSLFKSNQEKGKAKGAKDQAVIDSIKQADINKRSAASGARLEAKMNKAAADKLKSKGGTAPVIMTKDSGVAGKSDSKAKFGVGDKFVIRGNKANVTDTQLKNTGLTQAQYMKKWRASNKRPTAASASKATTKSTKTPKKVGGIRKFLLGADGKFGGARGAIDFLPGKSRKKKEDKPVKKMGGGMMKSKMASKGGARGGMKKKGYANGGLAMTKVNGKSVPAFAADGKGANDLAPTRRNMGGMMKSKGMSKGGAMKKKGYAHGGAVRSKMASKGGKRGGASSKPRGVGVAKRGYGKAMR